MVKCGKCRDTGIIDGHRSGYTHYETDAGEPCPSYHYEALPCPDCAGRKTSVTPPVAIHIPMPSGAGDPRAADGRCNCCYCTQRGVAAAGTRARNLEDEKVARMRGQLADAYKWISNLQISHRELTL